MFAKLIFISLILQLTEAIRPVERIESDNACPTLDGAGCKTCDSSSGEELCVTCKQDTDFLQLDKKSCKASCTGDGVIEDSGVNPKVCKCDADKGYQLQGGACVKTAPDNACPTLDGAGCKTCDSSSGEELCVTCKQDTDFLQLDKKSCKASCTGDGVIEDSGVNPKVCKCDADKGYQLQGGACVKTAPDNACPTLDGAGCKTCDSSSGEELCVTCKQDTDFLQLDKKSCKASCTGDGVIEDSGVNPKVCKCDADKGYQLQGGACVKTAPDNACPTLDGAGCKTCDSSSGEELCVTCKQDTDFLQLDKKSCKASCTGDGVIEDSGVNPKVCKCDADKGYQLQGGACVKTAPDNACPTLDGAGCKTCDSSSGEELCVTCKQDTDFLQLDKKSCKASCTGDGVIEDSGVNPKVCKCDADKGYQLQGGACVKTAPDNACPTLDGAGCKTCDSSSGEELCVTCKQDTDFLQLDKKSCKASCTGDGVIEDSGVNPKVCKCDADKGYQLQGGACVKTAPDNACPTLDGAGCKTCDSSSGEELCVTCKQDTDFLQLDKKSCKASCTGDGVIEDSGVNPKVCKCDADKGYQLQGGACVKTAPDNACPTLDGAGCKTCDSSSGEELCVTCKQDTDFLQLDKKSCKASCTGDGVIEDSGVNPKVCKCDADKGYQLQGGACVKTAPDNACKTENCQECTNKGAADEVCTKCNPTHYLTPTNQCVFDCTAIGGYYGDSTDKKCKKCSSECAGCVGPASNQCSACPAGRALTYSDGSHPGNGGSCGDACAADKNGCKVCGARIGGTDYCSHCSDNAQAPLNGNCATSSARVAFCTTMGAGVCTKCAANYFLQDGGCYEATRQPGKQICTLATNDGKCQTCVNSLQPNNGVCPLCHSTCKMCSVASNPDKCMSCAAGYYMLGLGPEACVSCESDSGSVKGVSGCLSCVPPSGNTGSVLCYLTKDDGTGGSTNKSGLSTGAIAGIAVAVIIVVGGLVGFLCWWFLCRGKA